MPDSPTALATADEFRAFGSFATLVRDFQDPAVDRLMLRATRAIESRCERRLAPFTITESSRAHGVDPDQAESVAWPLDQTAALGLSQARAYGVTTLVRDVWLREYAPTYPDLWVYSGVSITLARSYGDTEQVPGTSLEGPEPDTGHLRFRLGTFTPVGTTVRVTYSGGYQTIPEDLNTACIYQAAKLAIISAEPQSRQGMDLVELDALLLELIVPFVRS